MKKIFLVFAAAACLLGSCSEDNTSEEQGQGSISITGGGVINAGPDGMEQAITVTSSGDWRLSGICEWAHPSATSGKSGDVVTFTIDPNSTGVNRDATFKFFTGAAVTPLKIISSLKYAVELKSESELNLNKNEQSLGVNLTTNIAELTVAFSDGGDQWIHFDKRTDAFGTTGMSFKVDANATYTNRSSVISIGGEGADPVTITVNQKQTDIVIPEQKSYSIDVAGGNLTIKLQTNIEYVVEVPAKYAAWLHHQAKVAPTSRAMADQTETFTIDVSTGLRSGKVNFKSKDGAYSLALSIIQNGNDHIYVTIPDLVFQKYLVDNEYVVAVEGSKCEITIAGQEATSFVCNGLQIVSLEGIEAFTKVTSLSLATNRVAKIVLGNSAVKTLDVSKSAIAAVEISGANVATINAKGLAYSFTSLDVSACPLLKTLDISNCYYLQTLTMFTGQTFTKLTDSYAGYYTATKTYNKVYK